MLCKDFWTEEGYGPAVNGKTQPTHSCKRESISSVARAVLGKRHMVIHHSAEPGLMYASAHYGMIVNKELLDQAMEEV